MLCKAYLKVKNKKAAAVQYNPNTLHISSTAPAIPFDNPQTSEGSDYFAQSVNRGNMTLSVELIIDNAGIYTVQETVEGFLGLFAKETTKDITFFWGEMKFYGRLQSLNASYDMFDADGTPLRGKIKLSLRQDGTVLNYWNRAYEKMFR